MILREPRSVICSLARGHYIEERREEMRALKNKIVNRLNIQRGSFHYFGRSLEKHALLALLITQVFVFRYVSD